MKTIRCIYSLMATALLSLGLQSCFQDMEHDIPFNYPEQPPPDYFVDDFACLPFDEDFNDNLGNVTVSKVGEPTLAEGHQGKAYQGAADSYVSIPTTGFGKNFSIVFWYKMNTTPDRAGLFNCGAKPDNRTVGLRMFREGSVDSQNLTVIVGIGASDVWVGGLTLENDNSWNFIAVSISETAANLYLNGKLVKNTPLAGSVDWTGCNLFAFGSGIPNFNEWNHLSDNSLFDEAHFFHRALTEAEIIAMYTAE